MLTHTPSGLWAVVPLMLFALAAGSSYAHDCSRSAALRS